MSKITIKRLSSPRDNWVTNAIILGIVLLMMVFAASAFAQDGKEGSKALAAGGGLQVITPETELRDMLLPALIKADTNMSVFLRRGVPTEVQVAALRLAWRMDPAIRDFREMGENDWDFTNPNSIPGFGDLEPETDPSILVAHLSRPSPSGPPTQIRASLFGFSFTFPWN